MNKQGSVQQKKESTKTKGSVGTQEIGKIYLQTIYLIKG